MKTICWYNLKFLYILSLDFTIVYFTTRGVLALLSAISGCILQQSATKFLLKFYK